MKIANWWHNSVNKEIICDLCPRYCNIKDGQQGFCSIRFNEDGVLFTAGYSHPTGFAIDPIEKKPLFHFYPGSRILSFGTVGCNLGCKFCQNWTMSKADRSEEFVIEASPDDVVKTALKSGVNSIAYTYNEPTIFGEYVIDVSKRAKQFGIYSVMVTAGYVTPEARIDIYKYIDAANVDLKSINENFYYKLTNSHLQPVLETLIWIKYKTKIWLEVTNLLIPGENDSDEEIKKLCEWILINLDDEVPLHFSAFHPAYKMLNHKPTTAAALINARKIAFNLGLKYVYIGNVYNKNGQITFCPVCNKELIERNGYLIIKNNIVNGKCFNCNHIIKGKF